MHVFLTAVRGFDMSLAGTGFTVFSAAIGALAHAASLYAAFGLLAGLVALQFVIAWYVYRKVL